MGLLKDEEHVKDNRNALGLIEAPTSLEPSAVKTNPKGLSPKKTLPSTSFSNSPRHKKKTGVRQARRIDNNNYLKTLLDDDFQAGEPDISDFISSHSSAFEQLFLQEKNMEIWSEFMNRSGEEQDRFLQEVEEGMIKVAKKASLEQDNNGNAFTKLEIPTKGETPVEVQDKRSEHPAHSPEGSFNRISTRLQTMLRRRHLPKGALELHEGELMMWFTDDPGSVYISTLHSSFDRLLLHAVCQYLGLSSESFDCDGQRQTRVENNNESFNPPAILLSTYLDSLR